jgi:DNA-directed RNA polymerase subunit M/transcription elongation factor TFIIS
MSDATPRFCPNCGATLRVQAPDGESHGKPRYVCPSCGDIEPDPNLDYLHQERDGEMAMEIGGMAEEQIGDMINDPLNGPRF